MRYQFSDNTFALSHRRSVIQPGRSLVSLWLILIAVVFLACTSLPKPEIKTLTLAYDPRPQRRLAAALEIF